MISIAVRKRASENRALPCLALPCAVVSEAGLESAYMPDDAVAASIDALWATIEQNSASFIFPVELGRIE